MAEKIKPPPSPTADLDGFGWVTHAITAALGLLALVGAVAAYRADVTPTLVIALVVSGALLPALSWLSLNKSRVGWAFLISVSTVLAIMTLFGAPKVRTLVGVPMSVALILPLLFGVAVFGLSLLPHRYKE